MLVSRIFLKNQVNPSKIKFLGGFRGLCSEDHSSNPHAKKALLDYLHGTRGLAFPDAEHMSRNSPNFLNKIMRKVGKVGTEEEFGSALRRLFADDSINEFEPFFESLELKVSELESLLLRDKALLENYNVLCNYGVPRGKIGRMCKDANEIFWYEKGVLDLKLRGYEEVGLSRTSIAKIVASVPTLLIGEVDGEFVKVLEALEAVGIERDWIGDVWDGNVFYDWGRMTMTVQFFVELGFTEKESGALIKRHPDFLLNDSGKALLSVAVLLLKLGGTRSELVGLFSRFPGIQVGCFQLNLWEGLQFLIEIEMNHEDIQKLLRSHAEVFGSCFLKTTRTILRCLHIGKKRMRQILKENPHELEKYTYGKRLNPLPKRLNPLPRSDEVEKLLAAKRKFLLQLGFADDSPEMKKAFTVFRGKGDELQERYEFLVKTGLDPNDVSNMIKTAPHILNQKVDVLQRKIEHLVNNLGYPLSSLVAYPSYMSLTPERVSQRVLMYNWLKDRGLAREALALSTFLACSDKMQREDLLKTSRALDKSYSAPIDKDILGLANSNRPKHYYTVSSGQRC